MANYLQDMLAAGQSVPELFGKAIGGAIESGVSAYKEERKRRAAIDAAQQELDANKAKSDFELQKFLAEQERIKAQDAANAAKYIDEKNARDRDYELKLAQFQAGLKPKPPQMQYFTDEKGIVSGLDPLTGKITNYGKLAASRSVDQPRLDPTELITDAQGNVRLVNKRTMEITNLGPIGAGRAPSAEPRVRTMLVQRQDGSSDLINAETGETIRTIGKTGKPPKQSQAYNANEVVRQLSLLSRQKSINQQIKDPLTGDTTFKFNDKLFATRATAILNAYGVPQSDWAKFLSAYPGVNIPRPSSGGLVSAFRDATSNAYRGQQPSNSSAVKPKPQTQNTGSALVSGLREAVAGVYRQNPNQPASPSSSQGGAGKPAQASQAVSLITDDDLRRGILAMPGGRRGVQYAQIINQSAKKYGLNPMLLAALISQESGFRSNAVSKAGALGIGQFMPSTARSLHLNNPNDPNQAIPMAARYLKANIDSLRKQFPNAKQEDIFHMALTAYNAGKGGVLKAVKRSQAAGLDNYVQSLPYQEQRQYAGLIIEHLVAGNKAAFGG